MTKKKISESLRGLWNNTVVIDGIKIARVCWHEDDSYKIIENEETFKDATQDEFIPITTYRTKKELVDALYRAINK